MKYTEKQKENIIKAVREEAKLWTEASKRGAFKNLKSDIKKGKNEMNKIEVDKLPEIMEKETEIDFLKLRLEILRKETKREQSNKKYWIDKYSELEEFIFDLLHSNDNLNIKYSSRFSEIRNK